MIEFLKIFAAVLLGMTLIMLPGAKCAKCKKRRRVLMSTLCVRCGLLARLDTARRVESRYEQQLTEFDRDEKGNKDE